MRLFPNLTIMLRFLSLGQTVFILLNQVNPVFLDPTTPYHKFMCLPYYKYHTSEGDNVCFVKFLEAS